MITSFGLIGEIVDPAALTEGLAWLTMGINLGYAVGAALVGGIADAHGARVAFGVAMAAGLAMAVTGLALYQRLRSAPVASPVAVG